jgi:hypothetical protein
LGHKKQLNVVKSAFPDGGIVCLMSGNYVQRGAPAIIDKSLRAKAAVQNGADLVLELPVTAALSSAEGFAQKGVEILAPFCDRLCFGAETANAERLQATAKALLSNSFFEAHMMESGGAVERIFNKVTSSENANNQDTVAQFDMEDFVLTTDFVEEMDGAGADRKAVKLANWLIPDEEDGKEHAQKIADYLNQHVEEVIQSCAGIESGDFEQIFKEIRQERIGLARRLSRRMALAHTDHFLNGLSGQLFDQIVNIIVMNIKGSAIDIGFLRQFANGNGTFALFCQQFNQRLPDLLLGSYHAAIQFLIVHPVYLPFFLPIL